MVQDSDSSDSESDTRNSDKIDGEPIFLKKKRERAMKQQQAIEKNAEDEVDLRTDEERKEDAVCFQYI